MSSRYDSRSRFFIETERLGRQHEKRLALQTDQQEALTADDSDLEPNLSEPDALPGTFATIDTEWRENATQLLNVDALARATAVVEERAKEPKPAPRPVIPNSAALGLQELLTAIETQSQPPVAQPLYAQAPPNATNGSFGPMAPPTMASIPGHMVSTDPTASPPTRPQEGKGNQIFRVW